MSNPEIARHFLALQPLAQKLSNVNRNNVLTRLQECFQDKWAWEVADERLILDGTFVSTTVMLYMPGRVCTGRSVMNTKNYSDNHLEALVEACKLLMDYNATTVTTLPQTASQPPQQGNMTPEQIMAAVNPQQAQAPQPQPFGQPQPATNDDLPFYFGPTDPNAPPEVKAQYQAQLQAQQQQAQQQGNPQSRIPVQYQGRPPEYYQPKKPGGLSQYQKDRTADFKKKWDILNDEMLANYVLMWNPSATNPYQALNPGNLDDFLDWTDRLEKQGC